jgi:hypothetical protein
LPDDQIELEILHCRIQRFLDRGRQAMNLINEEDVVFL